MALDPGTVVLAAEGGSGGGFWEDAYPILPHPGELIFGLIAFAILYWIVKTKVVPRFEEAYAERTAAIEGGMDKAEEAQREAQAALDEYRAQLAEARGEAARIRQDATEQGAAIIAQMREEAQVEARRVTVAAQQQIEADRQQAYSELRSQVGRMATDLAERIVGEVLRDDERQRRVVDRFLVDLEQSASVPSREG